MQLYICIAFSRYLPQVLLKALMCGSEQRSNAEAVRVFLVSNARLFQKRVQFLSDVRLYLVMTVSLREREGKVIRSRKERGTNEKEAQEVIFINLQMGADGDQWSLAAKKHILFVAKHLKAGPPSINHLNHSETCSVVQPAPPLGKKSNYSSS